MRLSYKYDNNGGLYVECPFNTERYHATHLVALVGAVTCRVFCKYFIKHFENLHEVECNRDTHIKLKLLKGL